MALNPGQVIRKRIRKTYNELLELLKDQVSEPDAANGQPAAEDDRLLADLLDSPGLAPSWYETN